MCAHPNNRTPDRAANILTTKKIMKKKRYKKENKMEKFTLPPGESFLWRSVDPLDG